MNHELTQDECDAIGADGRDGRGTITCLNLTTAETTALIDYWRTSGRTTDTLPY